MTWRMTNRDLAELRRIERLLLTSARRRRRDLFWRALWGEPLVVRARPPRRF
jgi:hypothetical protein